jgi:hypothetical protein
MTYHKSTTDEMPALLIGLKNFHFKIILLFMSIYLMGGIPLFHRRLSKLEMLKRRGKGPPKKGQGRRAVKRSK